MITSKPDKVSESSILLGGQAVLEGVMMRGPGRIATAVRRADGTIAVQTEEFSPVASRIKLFALPFLRGAVGMIEMLFVGMRALNFSADIAMQDVPGKNGVKPKKSGNLALAATVIIALLFGLLLFFVTPLFLATFLFDVEGNPLLFNLAAGIIRMIVFLVYLAVIAQLQDIQRLFAYHGAEHKSVFAYELGRDLSVREAGMCSRFHPRCGTSFLLIVMLSAILFFAIVDALVIQWRGSITIWIRLAVHLPLVPCIAGLSYEVIRLSARNAHRTWARWLSAPGLWLQRITTREPDDRQLEVALTALRASLAPDWQETPAPSPALPTEA